MILFLSLRNLWLMRKRYALVAFAVLFGFLIMTFLTGAAAGMQSSMRDKAARYFAGHVSITGYPSVISKPGELVEAIKGFGMPLKTVSIRSVYYRNDALLFFGGETVRQRRLTGIDFSVEGEEFSRMGFSSGGMDSMRERGGILVSESVSKLTGARVGDDVTLYVTTETGQYNTAVFVVRGIFSETSLFAYNAYLDRRDMNELAGRSGDYATDIALYLPQGIDSNGIARRLTILLPSSRVTFPYLENNQALRAFTTVGITEETLAVFSLDAHLDRIKDIIDALIIVTYFVLAVFLVITAVGTVNTYRVVVYERTREIGTMRALGMKRFDVVLLFMCEAFGLALASSILGFALGIVALKVVSFFPIENIPGSGLILERGRIRFALDPLLVSVNFLLVMAITMIAASGPAMSASRIQPAEALRDA